MVGRTLSEISVIIDLSWVKYRNKDYRIVNTLQDLLYHIEEMKKVALIGVDTETTGTNICSLPWTSPHKDRLVGICISYRRDQGIYIPLEHTEMDNCSFEWIVKYLFPVLETKPSATHNGIFDYKVFYSYGCKLNIVHDSMLLLFNIYSKVAKGTKKLKTATRLLYGDTTIDFEDIFESTSDYTEFKHVDPEVARIYACADPDYTLQIVEDNVDFFNPKQLQCYLRDVSKIPLIAVAEYNGKPVDMVLLEEKMAACKQNIQELKRILFNYVGWSLTKDPLESYRFNVTSTSDVSRILYDILHVPPVNVKNKTGYKVDKNVLKKLANLKQEEVDPYIEIYLKDGIPDAINPDKLLFSYKDLKAVKCLPAHLLLALRKHYKWLTSFFLKTLKETNSEMGTYYSSISMTNTETARLVDFLQTLDGSLKYLITYMDKKSKYMYVFDFAQIEYRVMAALSHMTSLCERLENSHCDFHRECAAIIRHTLPELITAAIRKMYKPINFSIPYGTGVLGLVSRIYGIALTPTEQKEAEKLVAEMMQAWEDAMSEIMAMLNTYRDIAVTPRTYNHPFVTGVKNLGYLECPDGRVRIFDLGDMSPAHLKKVRRAAGNTPIQEFARTIYLVAIDAFYQELVAQGLADTRIEDSNSPSGYSFISKVTINGFIHDEIFGFADVDVNPYYLYNIIYNKSMRKYKGHPRYYCGISICYSWKDGKDGTYEAPIDYVETHLSNQKIVEPAEDWVQTVFSDMQDFSRKDIIVYVEKIAGSALTASYTLLVDQVLSLWKDYYYKELIDRFQIPVYTDTVFKDKETDSLLNNLLGILLLKYDHIRVVSESEKKAFVVTRHDIKAEIKTWSKDSEYTELDDISYDDASDEFDLGVDDDEYLMDTLDYEQTEQELTSSMTDEMTTEFVENNISLLSKYF